MRIPFGISEEQLERSSNISYMGVGFKKEVMSYFLTNLHLTNLYIKLATRGNTTISPITLNKPALNQFQAH
ncbi:hypothetical protein VIGAN_09105900 [Vigna angularis var. angularis]|uniref:Uncharacterized protein n=1 Tax=Vigna angularis var. angularis TaxID=157739 RepID=A0A0S3SXB5_PHAAN|nr:hypothetical protein VIGAN_09105900 [Vigna angularis var. angularis]